MLWEIGENMEKLAHQIIEFYEKLSSWEHSVVKGSELTPGQMHAIEIIGHEKSLRMKELAEKLGVTTGTLTVTVDNLERRGLLSRQPHATDRRSYLVVLTEKGNELFKQHLDFHLKLTQELVAPLSSEEVTALSSMLGKILGRI